MLVHENEALVKLFIYSLDYFVYYHIIKNVTVYFVNL